MDQEKLKEILNRIPWSGLMVAIAAYYGYEYYVFTTAPESPLLQAAAQIEVVKAEIATHQKKLKEAEVFRNTLEARKMQVKELVKRLDDMKASISESLDLAEFMKLVITEAKKVGLTVLRLEPQPQMREKFYIEQPFKMAFRGVYVQLVVFLTRMSSVQRVVRVDEFTLKPVSASEARYVELEGVVDLKTYRYVTSSEDALGRGDTSVAMPGQAKAATQGSAQGGTPGQAPGSGQPGGGQ